MSDQPSDRRGFLTGLGRSALLAVGAAAVARSAQRGGDAPSVAPGVAGADVATAIGHDDLPPSADAETRAFLGPVMVGTAVGAWTVAAVYGPFRGALPMILAHADGRRVQVDLLRHDDASPPGIAAASAGHLYLVNRGRGAAITPPDLEAAIGALARALPDEGAALPLLSQAERHRRYPGAVYAVPA